MKKWLIILLITSVSLPAWAQREKGWRWGGGADYEAVSWGFHFHYLASSFKAFQSQTLDPELAALSTPVSFGFGAGLLGQLQLNEQLHLRLMPQVLFSNQHLHYFPVQGDSGFYKRKARMDLLEIPLSLRYQSERKKNYRMYLIAGGKFSQNIALEKDKAENTTDWSDSEFQIRLIPNYFSYQAGLGVDIYFGYFKMSPELKWSHSIGNLLDKKHPNNQDSPIERLQLRTWQFSLVFQ